MMIHDITVQVGKHKSRKRVGRGQGSGTGKTAGRGHKGAGSRAGYSIRPYAEGGQMAFLARIPKRGFSNANFRQEYHVINVQALESIAEDGAEITIESLAAVGVVRDTKLPLKVLGQGELTKKLTVSAAKFSESAREKIEKAGGTASVVETKPWTRAAAGKGKKRVRREEAAAGGASEAAKSRRAKSEK